MDPSIIAAISAPIATRLLSSIISGVQGSQMGRYSRVASRAANYAGAAWNPKSKLNKAAVAEAQRELYQAISRGIHQQLALMQRARARGLTSAIAAPERLDEARFLATAEAQRQADMQAQQLAGQRLMGSANALQQWLGIMQPQMEMQMAQQEANRQNASQLSGALGMILGKVLGSIGSRPVDSGVYSPRVPVPTGVYGTGQITDVPTDYRFSGQLWR